MPNNQPLSKPSSNPSKAAARNPLPPKRLPGQRLSKEELSRHQREVRATRLLFAGMGALLVVIAAILGFGWWREYASRPSDVVATVDGQNITLSSYARMLDIQRKGLEAQMQYMQAQLQSLGSDSSTQSIADLYRQQIQQMQFSLALLPDQTLTGLVDQQLIRQEAARRGITVSANEIDAEIQKEADQSAAIAAPQATPTAAPTGDQQGTPAPGATPAPASGQAGGATPVPTADAKAWLSKYLAASGLSETEFRSMVQDQLLYQKLSDAMGAEVPVFVPQVHARHILVDSEDKAKQIEDQLKNGANFADLAKADSTDTATKDNGGDLGWFPQGKMVPEFDAVAFSLQPGQISDPVKTDYGYHIIQVLEKDPSRPLDQQSLDQAKSSALSQWLQTAGTGPNVHLSLSDDDKNWAYRQIGWTPPSLGQ